MKKLFFIGFCVSILSGHSTANAQDKSHSIKLHLANSVSGCTKEASIDGSTLLGLSYDLKLNTRFGVSAKFSAWSARAIDLNIANVPSLRNRDYETFPLDASAIGKRVGRADYKFLDVQGFAELSPFANHSLLVKAGPSVAHGKNTYFSSIEAPDSTIDPDYCVAITKVDTRDAYETTLGAVTEISYEYLMWRQRIGLGADLSCRSYHNLPLHFNYGLHLGYRF